MKTLLSTLALSLLVVPLFTVAPVAAAPATHYQDAVDITFPSDPRVRFGDTFDACRSGCARYHQASDLMGERMWRLYAANDGVVCRIDDGAEDSYGRHLTICGDDGRRYRYLHLNNDTPGTDDGAAGLEHVYAPGIRDGVRVARGQHVAYLGDSGNAEGTAPHLHFDIYDDHITNPYGESRMNPYPSLIAALERGDVADGSAFYAESADRTSGSDRVATALELTATRFASADTAVIAPSRTPGEAIVAGPLAAALGAPVLVTASDHLDERVGAALTELGVAQVYLIGDVLAGDAVGALTALGIAAEQVTRLGSADLFETAAAVADTVWALQDAADSLAGSIEGEVAPPHDHDHAEETHELVVSPYADRSEPVLLDGATVSGGIAVTLVARDPSVVQQVDFHLDGSTDPVNTEQQTPYDLAGAVDGAANLLSTSALGTGGHTVTAYVTMDDGTVHEVVASFTVVNGRPKRAIVALGEHPLPQRSWPDSLMAGYYGSLIQDPVLLVRPDELPAATATALAGVTGVTIIGGDAAVTDAVETAIDARIGPVDRLFGADRYGTALAVIEDLRDRGLVDTSRVWAATGRNWPDAATAGPIVAWHGEVLLLIDGTANGGDDATRRWLTEHAGHIDAGRAIGGTAAVSDAALRAFRLAIT